MSAILKSHEIDEALLASDNFTGFMDDRRSKLLAMIEAAMGKDVVRENILPMGQEDDYYGEGGAGRGGVTRPDHKPLCTTETSSRQ
ncbi:hypothetical protein LZK80_02895 [Rhizobium leguminosarum]|nr:hypothetical protein LZK80_02895 [Rhizobium leguminosarum]